ncbi:MAG: nicotinamide-nucleotide amidohydrolase family protein [Alphaproteobacteria bacterium]|nr:nicotinamide-nucleotide amidohydrolase family protein [Alphaproteobacteria bacterium]
MRSTAHQTLEIGFLVSNIETTATLVGELLRRRGETISVAESSSGGLVSAALLAVPGASAYFLGGAVVYTRPAKTELLSIPDTVLDEFRSASEPHALVLARTARERLGADWGLAETGAAGPTGNRYGDAAGHVCIAIAGPATEIVRTIETGDSDRAANMQKFTAAALALAQEIIEDA